MAGDDEYFGSPDWVYASCTDRKVFAGSSISK
jgi:hypothetical protein